MTWWYKECLKKDSSKHAAYKACEDGQTATYDYAKNRDARLGHFNPKDKKRNERSPRRRFSADKNLPYQLGIQ